jgi:hypothetical protein
MQAQPPEDRRKLHQRLLGMDADARRTWINEQPGTPSGK